MSWYYVDQGKQAGPVDDAQLEQMRWNGQIQDETLIWQEGMENWKPYRDAKGGGGMPPPPAPAAGAPEAGGLRLSTSAPTVTTTPPEAVCTECGNMFPKENMIRYGNNWVCANCKPVFMQKVAEGVPHLVSGRGTITEEVLLARDYEVDIGGAISHAWEIFKSNAGLLIGAIFIVGITAFGVSFLASLFRVPFLNYVIGIFVNGPLNAGIWLIYVQSIRGQPSEIGDVFSGFKARRYWQLVLVNLIPTLLVWGVIAVIGAVAIVIVPGIVPARNPNALSSASPLLLFPLGLLGFIAVLAMIYISTCWRFAIPLVIDKGLRFWPALQLSRRVVMKHWWGTFALLLVSGFLGIAGVLACGVGVVVTAPVAFAAISTHYDKVFGDLAPQES